METIYGIQVDTDSLREAHERQKRLHQQPQQQQQQQQQQRPSPSVVGDFTKTYSGPATLKSPPEPTVVARSTSTSAIPSSGALDKKARASGTEMGIPKKSPAATVTGALGVSGSHTPPPHHFHASSGAATSPFLAAVGLHHHQQQHQQQQQQQQQQQGGGGAGAGQIRSATHSPSFMTRSASHSPGFLTSTSTTHSPAFLPKFYDLEHHGHTGRLSNAIPWLALPGTATPTGLMSSNGSRAQSPSLFGRRRSDGGAAPTELGAAAAAAGTLELGREKQHLQQKYGAFELMLGLEQQQQHHQHPLQLQHQQQEQQEHSLVRPQQQQNPQSHPPHP
ncbi:hypothetical protein BC939DRAFT_457306, partial [Gamsiella multidivaricata]|uniref:uncharacterized protein n=1 Tax=Gamsiella multidivaricata TaxID=101098 RepID=UPI00221ED3BC